MTDFEVFLQIMPEPEGRGYYLQDTEKEVIIRHSVWYYILYAVSHISVQCTTLP